MSFYAELNDFEKDMAAVKGVRFSILGGAEILKMSVAEIFKTDTFLGTEPVPNGLFDLRMGALDHDKLCQTCEQKNTFCPGHFGHIVLAKPVFYIQFFDWVKKILKCVCFRCSRLLVDPDGEAVRKLLDRNASRQKRWDAVVKLCAKEGRCGSNTTYGCGAKQPERISKEQILKIAMEWKDADDKPFKQILFAEDVLRIFKRITDRDVEVLGLSTEFSRPESMICEVFPVLPPCVRPSVRTDTGQRTEDDLTHKLCDIVKSNNALKAKIEKGANKDQIDIASQVLQYHVITFVDNKVPGINPAQQRNGRPLKSLEARLQGKTGRIRGNLTGKRTDLSARSVITPDPNISIDELGVPQKIAMNLTFPEIVNKRNKAALIKYVRNGPETYPGAKYLQKHNGPTLSLKYIDRDTVDLGDGDVVHRHLIDNDPVLFNRQPSLHKYSMLCHRIKIMPHDTFRLNVCVCPCYNSDFDGDEMNMHVPQSVTTATELVELASVPSQVISVRECKPIISIVQDIPLGVYRMTKSRTVLTDKQFYKLACPNLKFAGRVPEPLGASGSWTGRQLISTIIPDVVNVELENKSFDAGAPDADENFVRIANGQLLQGTIDKTIYQARTRGIVHSVFNELGPEETRIFFDNTQRLVCDWLVQSGFSVGISDLVVSSDTTDKIRDTIDAMKKGVHEVISQIHAGAFENKSIDSDNDYFEAEVNKLLNTAIATVGKQAIETLRASGDDNRMINMVDSGSKGSVINVSQIVGCLGQQNVDGKRIPYGFDDRTLPHYTKYDDGPESRGFVQSSFIQGLTPQEFFFHAMGGREGLIDTAVKTSETGYIQRKLVKAMEDCIVGSDGTVRNASGAIVQFLYGEDGMDASKVESQHLAYVKMGIDQLQHHYLHVPADPSQAEAFADHFREVLRDREFVITELFGSRLETNVMYPIGFDRMIRNMKAVADAGTHGRRTAPLDALAALRGLDRLCEQTRVNANNPGNRLFRILARHFMSPQRLINLGFNQRMFDHLVAAVRSRFQQAIVHPAEVVGIVAAQSIGEPCTQLTLNTFHLSGVASASKAVRGVPRIKELLSVTKNMKSPSATIYLDASISQDKAMCKEVLDQIETTRFRDIVTGSTICFEPHSNATTLESDKATVDLTNELNLRLGVDGGDRAYHWWLRVKFDRRRMYERNLLMSDVVVALTSFYDQAYNLTVSDDNSEEMFVRIGLHVPPATGDKASSVSDVVTELKALEKNIMDEIEIKGVKNIMNVTMRKSEYHRYDPDAMAFGEEKHGEWLLETNGTNLLKLLGMDKIDSRRTKSNSVNEIYEIFGIEAARQVLYDEISDVIKDADLYVNSRHFMLLVDVMTSRGHLLSVDRHGINRSDIGPLAKSSFEETTFVLTKAGVFSEVDTLQGISANVMMGQVPPCGTGTSDILFDAGELPEEDWGESGDDDERDDDDGGRDFAEEDLYVQVPPAAVAAGGRREINVIIEQ